jgi:thiol-disulfide isomerase/thioredoxin
MLFLTSDKEFIINDKHIVYFYSVENVYPLNKDIFNLLDDIEKQHNVSVLCVDIDRFKNLTKRCQITELPTFLLFKDKREIKRITGMSNFVDMQTILTQDI